MLKVKKTTEFNLSYIRYSKIYKEDIFYLDRIVSILINGHKLNPKYKDHKLRGKWSLYRECHVVEVSNDWLLIYQLTKRSVLLVDTGSHKELFGKQYN